MTRKALAIALTVLAGAAPVPDAAPKVHPLTRELLAGGPAPVWVFFADKGPIDTTRALAALQHAYNPRAIERRRLRRTAPGLFDERDLPVHPPYAGAVRATGALVHTTSRWLNAVSVTATPAQVGAIAALPFVEKVQPVLPVTRPPTPRAAPGETAPPLPAGTFYGLAAEQLQQINVIALHEQGFTGAGVVIGVLDTGFRTTHAAFNHPDNPLQVIAEYDFLDDDPETGPEEGDLANQHDHGTLILGTMAAYNPGFLVGSAPEASYILAKVEDLAGEYAAEEFLFVAGLEFIEANGGDVATSSVVIFDHYTQQQLDGLTSVMTVAYNTATSNGVHCFQGAGNQGHDANPFTSSLLPPADSFQVITLGSVDSTGATASFTSDGPTADGRVKPELLARGVLVWTVSPADDTSLAQANGASLATPTTAGAAACLVQAHPEWTVDQMRWALIHTASDYVLNGTFDPLYVRGYGIVDALGAAGSDPPAPGDLDEDGVVDIGDFLTLLAAWGPCPAPCPPHCVGDVDTDCTVGILDLLILLANWG